MKSREVYIRFAFCSSVRMCGRNREQIFRLPKSSQTMVCAVSLLTPNSSTDTLKYQSRTLCQHLSHFLDHFWGSACRWPTRTWLILSHFLPFAKAFEPFVKVFSAHCFPPVHLHQNFMRLRCSFPHFVAELDVCTLLHYAVTLHPTLTTLNWPQSVHTAGHMQSMLFVDCPHVSEEPCTCAYLHMTSFTKFLYTPCIITFVILLLHWNTVRKTSFRLVSV